jgi:hypothetical protein
VSDVAKLQLRGPVRTLRTEHAEWDAAREDWKPARHRTTITFRPDGMTSESDFHNPDGTIFRTTFRYDDRGRLLEVQRGKTDGPVSREVHSYDEAGRRLRTESVGPDGATRETDRFRYDSTGRKTKVTFLPTFLPGQAHGMHVSHSIEGMKESFSAPGATTMTTSYGERDVPEEVVLHDANHAVVLRVTFTRDRDGRTLREEVQFGGSSPFPGFEKEIGEHSPEEAAKLAALLANVFPRQTLQSNTYAYDRHGRILERSTGMGQLGETRTTFRYDDQGNPIEEITDEQHREVGADADGTLRARNENVQRQDVRYDYQYDREGNWTERIVSSRLQPGATFQRSNVERRQITYYPR